jgi:mRNA-degrading endonuclease RelE of RelBE toxin-antitoxin system
MPESPTTQILVADEFKRQIRDLAKRYRQIRKDIEPLITQLKQGETPGDQISGVGYTVLKVRTKNSDIRKGKSGGYRIIYQILAHFGTALMSINRYFPPNLSRD